MSVTASVKVFDHSAPRKTEAFDRFLAAIPSTWTWVDTNSADPKHSSLPDSRRNFISYNESRIFIYANHYGFTRDAFHTILEKLDRPTTDPMTIKIEVVTTTLAFSDNSHVVESLQRLSFKVSEEELILMKISMGTVLHDDDVLF